MARFASGSSQPRKAGPLTKDPFRLLAFRWYFYAYRPHPSLLPEAWPETGLFVQARKDFFGTAQQYDVVIACPCSPNIEP